MRHRPQLSPDEEARLIERLSTRELETVRMASEGMTDRDIAQALGIAVGTLNTYWTRIRSKVGLHTRSDIVRAVLAFHGRARDQEIDQERQRLTQERREFEYLATALVCLAEEVAYPFAVLNREGHIIFENRPFCALREEAGATAILERLQVVGTKIINDRGIVVATECEVIYSAAHPDGYRAVRVKLNPTDGCGS